MTLPNIDNAPVRWPLSHSELRLKIDLAADIFGLHVPSWLPELRDRLFRAEQIHGSCHPTLLSRLRSLEYETFLSSLWKHCTDRFGLGMAEALFQDEPDALGQVLHKQKREREFRELARQIVFSRMSREQLDDLHRRIALNNVNQ